MSTEGNGAVWHVSFVGTVAQEVKTLYKQAKEAGLGDAYIDSIKYARHRMRLNPMRFGELIRRRPKSGLVVHVRVVEPLLFEFAIHEETHNVLIQRVQLML
jgi:hypothetical protein